MKINSKIINLSYGHFHEKTFTHMSYHLQDYIEFKEMRQGYAFDLINKHAGGKKHAFDLINKHETNNMCDQ